MTTSTRRDDDARATDLTTLSDVLACFVRHRSPQILLAGATAVLVVRLMIGEWSVADLVVVALTIVLTGPVEWVLHLLLLHAPADSFRMRRLGTGVGHREHHLDPSHVGWLLLAGRDAATFQLMIAGFTAAWLLPGLWLLGLPLLAPWVTGVAASWLVLLHYEWVHLLVHTRYRARNRYYRRLTTNHRLHHFRNEHHWLGVTSNLGDRLLGTYPASKSDVPLSDTARSLQ